MSFMCDENLIGVIIGTLLPKGWRGGRRFPCELRTSDIISNITQALPPHSTPSLYLRCGDRDAAAAEEAEWVQFGAWELTKDCEKDGDASVVTRYSCNQVELEHVED